MFGYLSAFLGALIISAALTWFFSRWAKRRQLFMPAPRERDVHTQVTPRVGGLAVVVAFFVTTLAVAIFAPQTLHFIDQRTLGIDQNLLGLLLGVAVLTSVNVLDDLRGVSWPIKLLVQIAAALIVFGFGVRIPWLSSPAGGQIVLGALAWFFVVVWLVGVSNIVNLLDGINGLAGGVVAITLVVLFFLSRRSDVGQYGNAMLSIIALGALVGFLPFNFGQAKAFLGDTGSVFLGFVVGVIAIISGGKVATAFLVLAIPALDALVVIGSRLLNRQSPFQADKKHLHHRLLAMGMKDWQIDVLFYTISLVLGLIALSTQTIGKAWAGLAAILLMIVLICIYSYAGKNSHARN